MPRNGSSVYSLPAGNPVIAGTIIATTWANTTLTDIATALTNSLSTDGSTASVSLAGKTMSGGTFSSPTVSGTLDLTGGQIQFPAVQVPSADVNCLDDYEEGSWTPVVTCASPGTLSVTYPGVRVARYTKIGNIVHAEVDVVFSYTLGTGTGVWSITGLPFPSVSTSGLSTGVAWEAGLNVGGGAIAAAPVAYVTTPTLSEIKLALITTYPSSTNNDATFANWSTVLSRMATSISYHTAT